MKSHKFKKKYVNMTLNKMTYAKKNGCGLFNNVLNKLIFELYYSLYKYLWMGTKLENRLKSGDPGINELVRATTRRYIFYFNTKIRIIIMKRIIFWEIKLANRVLLPDIHLGEYVTCYITVNAMKFKRKLTLNYGVKIKRR